MTDRDVIGITTNISEYFDNSNILKPGIEYKYAIAGANYAGEGLNSNELYATFGEELPSDIDNDRTIDGIYYTNSTQINSGASLTINPRSEIYFYDDAYLKIFGVLNSQGTESEPIIFTSINNNPAHGSWYGIRFENSSIDASCILKYCDIQYATYGVYAYYANPTINSCWIHNNIYGLRGESSSMVVTNNKIYNDSQDGGYFFGGTPKLYSNSIYDNTGNRISN